MEPPTRSAHKCFALSSLINIIYHYSASSVNHSKDQGTKRIVVASSLAIFRREGGSNFYFNSDEVGSAICCIGGRFAVFLDLNYALASTKIMFCRIIS